MQMIHSDGRTNGGRILQTDEDLMYHEVNKGAETPISSTMLMHKNEIYKKNVDEPYSWDAVGLYSPVNVPSGITY